MSCERCDQLPRCAESDGRLVVWPPVGHVRSKVVEALTAARPPLPVERQESGLALRLRAGERPAVLRLLHRALTPLEARETKVLFLPGAPRPLCFDDGARITDLATMTARAEAGWLVDMLAEDRLTTAFQPILHAADPGRVYAHECLLRGVDADGGSVSPGRLFDVARAADLLFQLDREARALAVRSAAATLPDGFVFINFAPSALYDPKTCLRQTLRTIETSGLDPERIVFEVVESDKVDDLDHLARIVDFYRGAGFRVALDDLGAGYASLNMIPALRPDFIKVDMGLVRGIHGDAFKGTLVQTVIRLAHDLGIEIVAEGIETAAEHAWLCELGADYVQGYLFAKPGPQAYAPAAGAAAVA